MMVNLLKVAYHLFLSAWLGTLVFVSVSAPIVFRHLAPDRRAAGDLVGKLLGAMTVIGWITMLGMLATLGIAQAISEQASKWGWVRVGMIVLMLILLAGYQFGIVPRIEAVGAETDFSAGAESPEREAFNRLHTWSTRTVSAIFLLGVGVIIIEVFKG